LSDVDGRFDGVPEFELIGFHRNNLEKWHLFNQLLGSLVVKTVFFSIVASSFKVEASNVAPILQLLLDGIRVLFLGDNRIHDGLIKRPSFRTTGSLDEGSQVRLGSRHSTEPHYFGFCYLIPLFILVVSVKEMLHPRDELFQSLRGFQLP